MLLQLGMGLLAITAVLLTTVIIVRILTIKILKTQALELNKNVCSLKIKECYDAGDYNTVTVGLYDDYENHLKDIEYHANQITKDIREENLIYV